MIGEESVEQVCALVGEFTDQQMVDEFDRFFRAQPAVCEFIVEMTQESGQQIQELSLFLSYMIFKTLETVRPGNPPQLNPEDVEKAFRENESWMERVSQVDGMELQSTIATSLERDTEPHLLKYVISELNEPLEDGVELDDEEKGEVFFVLKTVISSLTNEPKGKIIEAH